jgi:cytochrome-b5 reductase
MLKGISQNILKSQSIKGNFTSSSSSSSNVKSSLLNKNVFVMSGIAAVGGYFGWEYYKKSGPQALDSERYVPLKLMEKEKISPDSYRLRILTKQLDKEFPIPSCLYIKDDTIQVMRPYTPINPNPYKDGFVDLVIKRYENGSVSRTLSGFEPQNDVLHVRGPMIEEYEYKENSLDEVGMVKRF